MNDATLSLFQFHKGTIRTQGKLLAGCLSGNFNSIKVRLEHNIDVVHETIIMNFNSIKVRLEPATHLLSIKRNLFHRVKGTIRTKLQHWFTTNRHISIP